MVGFGVGHDRSARKDQLKRRSLNSQAGHRRQDPPLPSRPRALRLGYCRHESTDGRLVGPGLFPLAVADHISLFAAAADRDEAPAPGLTQHRHAGTLMQAWGQVRYEPGIKVWGAWRGGKGQSVPAVTQLQVYSDTSGWKTLLRRKRAT